MTNFQDSIKKQDYKLKDISFIGRLISKFPNRPRKSLDGKEQKEGKIQSSGTAFLIGRNLLITAAYNIFIRKFAELSQQIYFIPQILNQDTEDNVVQIKAISCCVHKQYQCYQNENAKRYDVAIILLEQNKYSNQMNAIDIEWSYKRWEKIDRNLTLMGYSLGNQNQFNFTQKTHLSYKQDQFIYYRNTPEFGFGGGPLIIKTLDSKTNNFKVIGLHKGVLGTNPYGITFNTLESSQEIIMQLVQQMKVEELLSSYQPSYNKLKKQFNKNYNNNGSQNENSQIKQLQKQNIELKQRIQHQERTISQLKQNQNKYNYLKGYLEDQCKDLKEQIIKLQIQLQNLRKQPNKITPQTFQLSPGNNQNFSNKNLKQSDNFKKYLLNQIFKNNIEQLERYYNVISSLVKNNLFNIKVWKEKYGVQLQQSKFYLQIQYYKISMKEFTKYLNNNCLQYLNLSRCQINDDQFKLLMNNSHMFKELKILFLFGNQIISIENKDFQKLPSLQYLTLGSYKFYQAENPLSEKSIMQLKYLKSKRPKIEIHATIGNKQIEL